MSTLKKVALFIGAILSAMFGGILVMITLGGWGRKDPTQPKEKTVSGSATVEVKDENIEADKAHADSINSALDKLP